VVRYWIGEKAVLYIIVQLENGRIVTKFMSEINFMSTAKQGDIIEMVKFGKTSLTLNCEVRNKLNHETIVTVDNIIMVNLGEDGKPKPHGKTKVEFVADGLAAGQS